MKEMMMNLVREEEGQGMVEYALIIGLIAVVLVVALTTLSGDIKDIFGEIGSALRNAGIAE